MIRVLAFAAALLAPVQALALSCLATSVENSFHRYHEATEAYLIVKGQLQFDETRLPKTDYDNQDSERVTKIPGQLTGHALSRTGFKTPFERKISVNIYCFGPWCGGAGSDQEVLTFVKREAGQYGIDVYPCPGAIFYQPTKKQLRRVKSCLNGNSCSKS